MLLASVIGAGCSESATWWLRSPIGWTDAGSAIAAKCTSAIVERLARRCGATLHPRLSGCRMRRTRSLTPTFWRPRERAAAFLSHWFWRRRMDRLRYFETAPSSRDRPAANGTATISMRQKRSLRTRQPFFFLNASSETTAAASPSLAFAGLSVLSPRFARTGFFPSATALTGVGGGPLQPQPPLRPPPRLPHPRRCRTSAQSSHADRRSS